MLASLCLYLKKPRVMKWNWKEFIFKVVVFVLVFELIDLRDGEKRTLQGRFEHIFTLLIASAIITFISMLLMKKLAEKYPAFAPKNKE